jgi:hypothetical protein
MGSKFSLEQKTKAHVFLDKTAAFRLKNDQENFYLWLNCF